MNNTQLAIEFPLVSVIIPAYNAEAFIEKTLNSVLSQTYQNLEVIVIDDGSKDRTVDLVTKFIQQDPRVSLLQQTNSGVAAARNLGIQKARGELIAPIDADDLWYPENLKKQVQCLWNSDPSVGLTYAWSFDIDENDCPSGEFRSSTLEGNLFTILLVHYFLANASSTVIRRSVFEKVGYYNENLRIQNAQGCEDWELYLRIAECYKFRVVPEFLIGYRKLTYSMSSDSEAMAKSLLAVWKGFFCKYPNISKAIYRLSLSSFYLYLAHQNSLYKRHRKTLYWLAQALKVDYITPFLRFGLYTIFIKSCYFITIEEITQRNNPIIFFLKKIMLKNKSSNQSRHSISNKKFFIARKGFKSGLEKIIHSLIPIIFGTPNRWKESNEPNLYIKFIEK